MKFKLLFQLSLVLIALGTACQPQTVQKQEIVPTTPAATINPTLAHTQTPEPTPTTQEILHPYTIEGLRERTFPKSEIKIEAPVVESDIYTRHAITYRSENLDVTGIMQIPKEGRPPFPVIVMNHGYFNRQEYRAGDGTDRAAEYLNRHGYLTVSPDYRSWGSSQAGPSIYYSGLVIDVVSLMAALPSVPAADTNRIGMWGHSMGGGVTMKVLMLETPVRAAALYSTVSAADADILARWGLGCIGDIDAGEQQLGCNSSDIIPLDLPPDLIKAYYESSMDPDFLRLTSPISNLNQVMVPIQIHFGSEDGKTLAGTPPEWSEKLYSALVEAGRAAEIYRYEGEKHSFNGDSWILFMERTSRFFDGYVKNPKP